MKKTDPRLTAWSRAPKHYDVVVTVSKSRSTKEEAPEDYFVQTWERRGRVLYPRVCTFLKPAGKAFERELGDQVRRFLETAEFERANPGVLPTEENYRAWVASGKSKSPKKVAKKAKV